MVEEMGALPSEHMLSAFGDHSFVAHAGHESADVIAIDEAGVAEHGGFLAKELLHLLSLTSHLVAEDVFVGKR